MEERVTVEHHGSPTAANGDSCTSSENSQYLAPGERSPNLAVIRSFTPQSKSARPGPILVLLVSLLVLQLMLSGAGQWTMWFPSAEHVALTQARTEPGEFLPFVQAHVPNRAVALYITPSEAIGEHWAYIQMSYRLYPSTVWWVTPTVKTSQMDPWIQSPVTGRDLSRLAAARGAEYIVFSGLSVPRGMSYKSVFAFDAERSVLQLE